MARVTFWISIAIVFYVYVGYPFVLLVWRSLARRLVQKRYWEPSVTIVLAAYNERETIAKKLSNCLALDYPRKMLQIVISLDGSTDGTAEIVEQFKSEGIEILFGSQHSGKAVALNRAVSVARGEVIVFVDSRQRLEPRAVRELAANFRDHTVGAVSGELFLVNSQALPGQQTADAVGLYWRYEKWMRVMESDIHSSVGVSGALYAIRRELFRELPEDTILDDVAIPMRVVLAGKRVVFEPTARAYDNPACCANAEFGRKIRTLMGNYQLLAQMPELLIPWRNPVFLQFVSHKVGRLVVPYFLAGLFISNLFLTKGVYLVVLALQTAWYLLACAGAIASRDRRPSRQVQNSRGQESTETMRFSQIYSEDI